MKPRLFFTGLALAAFLLLAVGLGGGYWLWSHSPLRLLEARPEAQPATPLFVPRQSVATLSLVASPEQLLQLRRSTADPGQRRKAQDEFTRLLDSLLAEIQVDYRRDLQPWVGADLTVAVTTLDLDRDATQERQPGYLLAIANRDGVKAREFLRSFWQRQAATNQELVFETENGVTLIYAQRPVVDLPQPSAVSPSAENSPQSSVDHSDANQPDSDQPASDQPKQIQLPITARFTPVGGLVTAVVGDQAVLIANDPAVIREALNTAQASQLSLVQDPSYRSTLEQLPTQRLALATLNLTALADWLSPRFGLPLEANRGGLGPRLMINLGADSEGLRLDTALMNAASTEMAAVPQPEASNLPEIARLLPAQSPFWLMSQDLTQLWQQVTGLMDQSPAIASLIQPLLDRTTQIWGLDFAEDIAPWVQGEYALGLVMPRTVLATNFAPRRMPFPDWIFVAERNAETDPALERLDQLAENLGYSVGAVTVDDQQVQAWTRLSTRLLPPEKTSPLSVVQAEVRGTHTTVGQYEVFATSIAAMAEALSDRQVESIKLLGQGTIARLPQPNRGVLYLDWPKARPLLFRYLPVLRFAELAGSPLFRHLQGLAISLHPGPDRDQGTVLLPLKEVPTR